MKKFVLFYVLFGALSSSVSLAKESDALGRPQRSIQYELRDDEFLNIVLTKMGSPADYFVSKDVMRNRQVMALHRGHMSRSLGWSVDRSVELLGHLRGVQEVADLMPLAVDSSSKERMQRTKQLAYGLATLVNEARFLNPKFRVIQGELSMSLNEFLRGRFNSLVHTLVKPMVYPRLNSYFSGIKATRLDNATRKYFWKSLSHRLENISPDIFRFNDEEERIYLLTQLMDSALLQNLHALSENSCEAVLSLEP